MLPNIYCIFFQYIVGASVYTCSICKHIICITIHIIYFSSDLQLSFMLGLGPWTHIHFYTLSLPFGLLVCLAFLHLLPIHFHSLLQHIVIPGLFPRISAATWSNLKPACHSHCGIKISINGDVLKKFWRLTRARICTWVWRWKAGELAYCGCPLHRLLGDNNFPKTCLMQPKKQWHRSSHVCFLSAGILLLQAPQCFGF